MSSAIHPADLAAIEKLNFLVVKGATVIKIETDEACWPPTMVTVLDAEGGLGVIGGGKPVADRARELMKKA